MIRYNCIDLSSFEILEIFENLASEQELFLTLDESQLLRFGYSSFIDIAQIYNLKFLTPTIENSNITLHFKKLDTSESFHTDADSSEKYGVGTRFFDIDKNDKFSFLYYYQKALLFCGIRRKKRILNIGVNRGDELKAIEKLVGSKLQQMEIVGIDYCKSAIEVARENFPSKNYSFYTHDIKELESLNLGRFDMIISIGTLQSSNLDFHKTFMDLYQSHLAPDGAILLGFPNCRWIDGEMIYGAKTPNYSFSEMGLVLKDIYFAKKYLQQKKFRVIISGKDYLFLSAKRDRV